MPRLQATIDDESIAILKQLLRRNDMARFVEFAIKHAYKDKNISNLFSWKNEPMSSLKELLNNDIQENSNKSIIPKSNVKFDDEFK